MRERFAKFNLELHPEKIRVVNFGRIKRDNANWNGHRPRTFDFLGFTHYWGKSRRGNWILCRKTSSNKFRRACKDLAAWLKTIRCPAKVKEWWPIGVIVISFIGNFPTQYLSYPLLSFR